MWKAYTYPARSPTTTEGCPSRSATLGEESATGLPASLRVWTHSWVAVKPAAWGTWVAWAAGAVPRMEVKARVAAAAAMETGR